MRITRYADSVSIDLELWEAIDLKAACETPEYHGPILVKIANGLAEAEKTEFADPSDDDARDAAGPETTEQLYALTQLKEAHGDAQEVDRVHDRHILYLFEDGTSFYVQTDGYTTERLEPNTTPDAPDEPASSPPAETVSPYNVGIPVWDVPDTDPEPDMNLPEQGYTDGLVPPVGNEPDDPAPPTLLDTPPPPTRTRKPRKA